MRKLLALLLVFSMASVASASLSISVNGLPAPPDSEITIDVSEDLILDVYISDPAGIPPFGGYAYLLVSDTGGTIAGGVIPEDVVANPNWNAVVLGPTEGDDTQLPPQGEEGIGASIFNLGFTPIPAELVVLDQVAFHCEREGDTVISLYKQSSGVPVDPATDLLDRIVIHQIPEPMTMALLGLGGLGLLRRRRS